METGKTGITSSGFLGGMFNGDFFKAQSIVSEEDMIALQDYNTLVGQGTVGTEAFERTMKDASPTAQNFARQANGAAVNLNKIPKASRAAATGMKLLSGAMNIAATIIIFELISGITKMVGAFDEMSQQAADATSKYKEHSSTLEEYKGKITELKTELSSENLTYAEARDKRSQLIDIQKQLIDTYGAEAEGINLVNGSLEDQVKKLDALNELKRQEWENEVNKLSTGQQWQKWGLGALETLFNTANIVSLGGAGWIRSLFDDTRYDVLSSLFNQSASDTMFNFEYGTTNIDRITKKVENFSESIKFKTISDELKAQLDSFEGVSFDGLKMTIAGDAKTVAETVTQIQTQVIGSREDLQWLNQDLKDIHNSAQDIVDNNWDTYNTAIQNQILNDDLEGGGLDYYRKLTEAYETYQEAVKDGDEGAIGKAKEEYSNLLDTISDSGMDESWKKYFENMYPELSDIVDDWKFEVNIVPKIEEENSELKTNIDKVSGMTTEEIVAAFENSGVNLDDDDGVWNAILALNTEAQANGLNLTTFLEQLREAGHLSSQLDKDIEEVVGETAEKYGELPDWSWSEYFKDNSIDTEEELDTWKEVTKNANSAEEAIKAYSEEMNKVEFETTSLEELSKALDNIQNAYNKVKSAIDEYNEQGFLSVDTFQELMSLEPEYLRYLTDEEGNLNLTTTAMNDYTSALIDNMAMKQIDKIAEYVDGLDDEQRQLFLTKGATDDATLSLTDYIATVMAAQIATGKLSEAELSSLEQMFNNVASWAEQAKAGIGKGGLSSGGKTAKNLEEEHLEKARDYAEKVAEIQEDLAEKEKQFAENMAEAWEEEHLEQLKDGLEKQKDIIDRYKKNVEVIDFGLEHIEEDDFANRADLLSDKLDKLKSYGAEMRAEFDRVANTIPQTADEAMKLANRLEELGSDMRDNVSAIRETATALQMLSIDVASTLIDNRMGELQSELDNIDKLIEILNSDYKDDYKYTTEVLSMDMLLPVYSEYDKKRREKQKSDKELIKTEQETQDKINEIVSKSLEMQAKQNAEARAKERKKLIEDMEKARKEAKKKLDEATKDYTGFLNTNKASTSTFIKEATKMFNEMELKFPEPDTTAVDDAIKKIKEHLEKIFGSYYKLFGLEAPSFNPNLGNGSGIGGAVIPSHTGVTSPFGRRTHPVTGEVGKFHAGTDYGAPMGAPIYAYSGGTVTYAGFDKGYGYHVIIDHGDGRSTLYAHASKLITTAGTQVKRGQKIAEVGSTGISTGPHLHFEYRVNGAATSPSAIFTPFAEGTAEGNRRASNLGIAGENYKPEILIDKATGKATYIDSPTIIDTSTTDVVGEKATARMPKFADGTIHRKVTSGTGVTAEDIDELIKKYCGDNSVLKPGMGVYFIEAQNSSGIDALTLFAIAAHESAYGTSEIAKVKSNLFGYGAYDADPLNMAYNYGYASDPENLRNGIMSISNLIGKWYVDKRGQDTLYEIEHDPNKTGFKYASDTQWDEKVASYVDKFAKDLEIDLSIDLPPASESSDPGKTDSDNPFSVEHIEAFYTNATDAISRIESKMIVDVQDVLNDGSKSDLEKSLDLARIKGGYSEKAAKEAKDIYVQLVASYNSWLKAIDNGTATWDLETYEAYRDTLSSVSDVVYSLENGAVESKREAANYEWENSNNWINERNEKGDWDIQGGYFDENGEWIQDSETQAWGRVVKWLKEKYPEEREKIAEAERKQVEAQLKETTDWINERNEKGDWAEGDSEAKAWQRYLDWLKEYHPNELGKIKEAEEKIFEAEAKEFTDWIDKRNEKGDWDNYGHFDANGEWIQDSEVQSWQRYIDWLEEFHPEEVNKIAEAKSKQVEAQLKETTDWIDERNKKGDWAEGDSEVKAWERYLEWLKTNYPNELGKIKEAEEKIYDSRRKEMEEAISDIDDYIAARNLYDDWDAYGDSELKAVQRQTEIIKDAYEQRLLSAEEYVDRLEDISQKIYTLGQNEVDKHLSNIDSYISARNFYNDWDVSGDSEIKAINRQLQILDEAYRLNLLSFEDYTEKSAEYTQKLYSVAKENIIETVSEIIEDYEELKQDEIDALNFKSSQKDSLKSLLQSYYDVTNAITDAQHEIDKELRASQSMYEYLNEETRELLFNQEDYNALNKELLDIQSSANELQNQYKKDILGASEETIAEITSQYQMQYETMMKQYEIAKAELDVAKKRQKLDNVLAERNVRMFINGQWQWVANTQDVIDAQNELADAEYEKKKQETSLEQTDSINSITAAQDAIATQINYLEADLEEVRNYWADLQEMLNGSSDEVAKALRKISKVSSPELKRAIEATGIDVEGFSSIMSESTTTLSDIMDSDLSVMSTNIGFIITDLQEYSKAIQDMIDEINGVDSSKSSGVSVRDTIAKMKANSEKWYTASDEERQDLHDLNWELGDSIGANYDEATGKWYSSDGKLLYSTSSKDSSSSGGSSSSTSGGKVVQVGSDGNAPAGTKVGDIVKTAGGNYLVVKNNTKGAEYNPASGLWSIKIDEEDADGTRYTQGGLTLMGEEGFEAFISSNGRLIPISQPTIGNIGAGGIVFNREQMANLRNLWDLSNIGKISPFVSSSSMSKQNTTIDNSIHINGLTVSEQGNEDWINGLRRYVATHK